MESDAPCPNPVSQRDAALLVGVLATLEGELFGHEWAIHHGVTEQPSEFYNDLLSHLGARLSRDGVLPEGSSSGRAVRQVISDLVGRLHYALGAYREPPPSEPVADVPPPRS